MKEPLRIGEHGWSGTRDQLHGLDIKSACVRDARVLSLAASV
jgi:hypothetical protein